MISSINKATPKPHLYFPMEIIERELTGNLVLALEALKNDWHCVIGTKKSIFDNAYNIPPGIIFLKSMMSCELSNLRRLKDAGHKLICLDVEGLVYTSMEEFVTVRFCQKTMDEVEQLFFWGGIQRNAVAQAYPNDTNKLYITGSPISDLWQKSKFHEFYKQDVNDLKSRFGNYIIIPSSFGTVNHYMGYEATLDIMKRDKIIEEEQQDKFYDFWSRYEAHVLKIFKEFLALLPELSAAFPNHKIIIRPHPSESHDTWKEAAKGLHNVDVVFEGSVSPWLLGADAILHWGCTTGLEGYLMGKPVVAYNPSTEVERAEFDHKLPQSISVVTDTKDETIETLKHVIANPDRIEHDYPYVTEGRKNLEEWISSADTDAAEKIFSHLSKLEIKPAILNDIPKEIISIKEMVWRVLGLIEKMPFIYTRCPERIKLGIESRAYGRHKTRTIDEQNLRTAISKLAKIQKIPEISVKKLGRNLFILGKS